MKQEDLRIGNYVKVNGKVIEVFSVDLTGINNNPECSGCSLYSNYEGYFSDNEGYGKIIEPIPLIETYLVEFMISSKAYDDDFLTPIKGGKNINFVHELQNIHYFLTGEELSTPICLL